MQIPLMTDAGSAGLFYNVDENPNFEKENG